MASTVRPKVKISDAKLEEVRSLWTKDPLENVDLELSISKWLTDMFNGQIRYLRQESDKKNPAEFTEL